MRRECKAVGGKATPRVSKSSQGRMAEEGLGEETREKTMAATDGAGAGERHDATLPNYSRRAWLVRLGR